MDTDSTVSSIPSISLAIPEQHKLVTANYAGFWRRFAGYLVDGCVIGVALVLPTYIITLVTLFGSISMLGPHPDREQTLTLIKSLFVFYGIFMLIYLVASWLYFALMESSAKQATLGKMAVGIIVTDLDGNRISFGKASGRFFGRILSGLIMDIGYIMAAFTEKKQALHDIMAGTLVLLKD